MRSHTSLKAGLFQKVSSSGLSMPASRGHARSASSAGHAVRGRRTDELSIFGQLFKPAGSFWRIGARIGPHGAARLLLHRRGLAFPQEKPSRNFLVGIPTSGYPVELSKNRGAPRNETHHDAWRRAVERRRTPIAADVHSKAVTVMQCFLGGAEPAIRDTEKAGRRSAPRPLGFKCAGLRCQAQPVQALRRRRAHPPLLASYSSGWAT